MHVAYAADRNGYTVRVIDGGETLDEYNAGNSPHDSTAGADGRPLSLRTLRRYARNTAAEIAAERGIAAVEYDADLLETV